MRTNSALPKDMKGLEPTTPYDVAEHLRTPEERAALRLGAPTASSSAYADFSNERRNVRYA